MVGFSNSFGNVHDEEDIYEKRCIELSKALKREKERNAEIRKLMGNQSRLIKQYADRIYELEAKNASNQ